MNGNDGTREQETIERALRAVRAEADPAVLARALRRLEAHVSPAHRIAAWLLRPAAALSAAGLLVVSVSVSYALLRATNDRALAPSQVVESILEDDGTFGIVPEDDATTADSGSVS